MKKILAITLLTLSTATAFADKNVVCVDRNFQDATISATFKLSSEASSVELFIPTGETSGESYIGECRSDAGADELSITCNVMTSTDSGYEVRIYSVGSPQLTASVTPWSMAGKGEAMLIPCDGE